MESKYSDNSIIISGKYKFTLVKNLPVKYLLNIYNSNNRNDKQLFEYVKENIDKIKARSSGKKTVEIKCDKIAYVSRKEARFHLKRIRETGEQEHKKPIRSYECDKCSAWHLTSMPYEVWKELEKTKP
ncbi:MAG: hypothetical protein NTW62_02015 [Candidatus Nomurabacteria bacterium]|nr:hypothetical protein [Candidatus Nomurabacteria bacterium]